MSDNMRYRYGPKVWRTVKKTGTVAIELGDILKFTSSGKVMAASASADADEIVGVAMSKSPATDATATTVRILEIGHGTVFEMTVAKDTQTYGQGYVIGGAQTLTKYAGTSLFTTATNVVAICAKDVDASATSVLVSFKPGRFQKDIATS